MTNKTTIDESDNDKESQLEDDKAKKLEEDKRKLHKDIGYNVSRWQKLTTTPNEVLAEYLNLTIDELTNRLSGHVPFTAWEVFRCAQKFDCTYDTLFPDIHVFRADSLWEIARLLPEEKFDQLFQMAVQFGLEAGLDIDTEKPPH